MARKSFNSTDMEIIELLKQIDVDNPLARTLIYLSKVDNCKSIDIERDARLRQPQVSNAIKHLEEMGWIKRTYKKKVGKGRPVHYYHLNKDIDEIFTHYKQEKQKEIDEIQQIFQDLDRIRSHKKLT